MKNIVAISAIILWAVGGVAQVHIKENTTISPKNFSTESIDADYFIAPQSGTLLIWGPDQRGTMMSSYPLSDSDSLWVIVNDTLIYKFILLPHLHLVSTMAMPCGISFYMYGWNNASDYAPADSSCTFTVNEGDRIIFALNAKYIAAMYPPYCYGLYLPGMYYPTNTGAGTVFLWSSEGCVDPTYGWFENFEWWNIWLNWVQSHTILLGETKYYYATEGDGTLTIQETSDPASNPGLSDVTFDDPVAESGSEKNPVYWEYKDSTGTKLPGGMIRLVGRYWEDKKTFKTILTAHASDGNSVSIDIEVTKPSRLGITPYPATIDVFGHHQDLDSLLIAYGGKYGIAPQVLKADIDHESSFKPAYRWEPFVDAHIQHFELRYMDDDFRYKKTTISEGNPGIPPDHSNVSPPYPSHDFSTIWSRLFDHSTKLNPAAKDNTYPIGSWYTEPAFQWRTHFSAKLQDDLKAGVDIATAKNDAIESANEWLRDEYLDGVMSEGIAQTRSAASYGLMQLQYPSATEFRRHPYPFDRTEGDDSHLPEYINIADTNLAYAVPFLLSKVNAELEEEGDGTDKSDEWTLGYE